MANIDIIYFDMGNTLVNFKNNKKTTLDTSIEETTDYINKQYNLRLSHETVKQYYEYWQTQIRLYQMHHQEVDITMVLNQFFNGYGLTFTEEMAIELYKVFYRQTFNNAQLEPYVAEILEEIQTDYKIGVISNMPIYSDVTKDIFRMLKIDALIDYYLFSYDIKICKPSPEIFRKATIDTNISANNSIMVGDSLQNDYLPAQQIGMHPLLYGKNDQYNSFSDYREMMVKVKKYERN